MLPGGEKEGRKEALSRLDGGKGGGKGWDREGWCGGGEVVVGSWLFK